MSRRNVMLLFAALLLVPAGLIYYNASACACVTPDGAAHAFLRTDFHRVVDAQQAFRADSGRYARSFDELQFEPDAALRLALAAVTDSTFRLEGESVRWPGVACTLDVEPATTSVATMRCSGRAPGPLGF